MSGLKNLIHEVHRRSLWQVIGIYLGGAWVTLQVVEQLTEAAGLPDWVRPFSLLMLLLGFPFALATAFVQEGLRSPAEDDSRLGDGLEAVDGDDDSPLSAPGDQARRLFTWRNAMLGGVLAFVTVSASVAGYFVLRNSGIGPAGSLIAKGAIDEGEPVLLAEFANTSGDLSLGRIVTEALRVDLASSQAVTVVEPALVRDILGRMGRERDEPLTADIAYEVAERGQIKAVIVGEVGSAGSGYILVATLAEATSEAPLATFRRTAKGPDDVIGAIDQLSEDIRGKAGESLREIRAEGSLEAVTTMSLDALRKYTEANRQELEGNHFEAKALLEEAIELDPEFAMAYRQLAVTMQDAGGTREEEIAAITKAYELRDHLTERERYIATAYYHGQVTGNRPEEMRAYRSALDRHPDDRASLNNLSIALAGLTRYDESIELLERAVSGPGTSNSAYTNLVSFYVGAGEVDEARRVLEMISRRDVWYVLIRYEIAAAEGDWESANQLGTEMVTFSEAPAAWRSFGYELLARVDVARGRMDEARDHFAAARDRSRADGRLRDAVQASLQLALAERLLDPTAGRDRVVMRDVLASGDFSAVPGPSRDYPALIRQLASSGLESDTRAKLAEWQREGGPTASGTQYEDVRRLAEALLRGLDDPGGAADDLLALRAERECPSCYTGEIAGLLVRADRPDEAVEEYERAWQRSQDDGLFAVRRVLARERLGELYTELGDPERAAEHYRAFAESWADADPAARDRVERARARGGDAVGT